MSDYDDTRESDKSWSGQHDWAIPAAPRKRRAIDTGQDRNTFKVLRENFRLRCMSDRADCWLCFNPIDYRARSGPKAFELDHAIPVSTAPELAMVESNFRASHSLCNRRRGDAEVAPPTGEPSECW